MSRPMGSGGIDVMLSPHARDSFPFSIECKNTKLFPSLAALSQSEANAIRGTLPAAVWKPPGKGMDKSIIYFNFEDFVDFWSVNFVISEIKSDNSGTPEYKPYTQEQSDDLGRQ